MNLRHDAIAHDSPRRLMMSSHVGVMALGATQTPHFLISYNQQYQRMMTSSPVILEIVSVVSMVTKL
jgi:hypothetical protein